MALLELIFLLCARFVALRQKRTYGWSWYGQIVVNFHNGADPVSFYYEISLENDGSISRRHRWMASRKLTKKELKIAEQVLLCRIKRERQKLPRGHNNTKLYDATIDALRELHEEHPMESISMNGQLIAKRSDAFGEQRYIDEYDYDWPIGTMQLCRGVILTPELLDAIQNLPRYITGMMLASCFRTSLATADFHNAHSTPLTWKSYFPWEKNAKRYQQEQEEEEMWACHAYESGLGGP